jgi:hypothetical protein
MHAYAPSGMLTCDLAHYWPGGHGVRRVESGGHPPYGVYRGYTFVPHSGGIRRQSWHRWWLLAEAAQLGHMVVGEYLCAEVSLKHGSDRVGA